MSITWSTKPLLKGTLPTEVIASLLEDIDFIRRFILIIIILAFAYPVIHRILVSLKIYNQLESYKQVVVLHHATEGIILSIVTPLFTYFMVKTNFVLNGDAEDVAADIISTLLVSLLFLMMYLYEISSRYEKPRAVLIVHHGLVFLDGYLLVIFPTSVMLKTAVILVYSICFEALTFIGLFMYRMAPLNKYTPKVILSGVVVFGVTRPIQVLWVGMAAFGSWNEPHHVKWQAIMQTALTFILTVIQVWSITINFAVWKRCVKKIKCAEDAAQTAIVQSNSKNFKLGVAITDHSTRHDIMEDSPSFVSDIEDFGNINKCESISSNDDTDAGEGYSAFMAWLAAPASHQEVKNFEHSPGTHSTKYLKSHTASTSLDSEDSNCDSGERKEDDASTALNTSAKVYSGVLVLLVTAMCALIVVPMDF